MFQKALAAGVVLIWLVGAPQGLGAQEKEVRAIEQATVHGWFSGLWSEFTAWLEMQGVPLQAQAGSVGDGGCDVDPNGCPHGA